MFEEFLQNGDQQKAGKEKIIKDPAHKTKKLNERKMEEDLLDNAAFIGIVASVEPYHLCWLLNNRLELDFCGRPEYTIPFPELGDDVLFPVFEYQHAGSSSVHLIYKLKNGVHFLLPGLAKKKNLASLDYLWLLKSTSPENDADIFNRQLKTVTEIQASIVLDRDKLTNLRNLLI